MKNAFDIEVNFKDVPLQPFEWESETFIFGIKVMRVNTKCIMDILTYETRVNSTSKILLLSDTKTSVLIKMNKEGLITKRSFLSYEKDLIVSEFACSMRTSKLGYIVTDKKLEYPKELTEETKIKEYLIDSIENIKDESKNKYLYYLYFDDIENYSKEKLIKSIKESDSNRFFKLYDFLINN